MSDTQEVRTPGPDTPFEIGLVMAGAISAGAYTAGVIDFLIQALDEWEQAKQFARDHPDDPKARECPLHGVKLKVLAGASAGGMTAALTAGLLGMQYQSVTAQPPADRPAAPLNNNLYRNWVNTIDIMPLLGTKDLDSNCSQPVQSVLDSSILLDIADNAFRFERETDRVARPYVSDPLHVQLTVTNLRGVPYAAQFANWSKTQQYEMMMHADSMRFVLSSSQPGDRGAFWLKPYDFSNPDTWGVLQQAALATGAFPVGLAPRLLKRPPSQYETHQWAMPGPHEVNGRLACEYWQTIPPDWPSIDQAVKDAVAAGKSFSYDFLCVDGGVMNNEPLDLARRVLTWPGGTDPAAGEQATRAVIMVLPFPNAAPFPAQYDGRTSMLKLLPTTFSALISQARFKPQEIVMANDPDDYSRFLIVPRRGYRADGTLEPYTIACGSLGGFGGFLSRQFREHDYQLGRRNCQWWLKQYFALPSEGAHAKKLFDRWTPEAREKFKILKAGKGGLKDGKEVVLHKLPIIPLLGSAVPDVPEPRWPTLTEEEFAALKPKVKGRLDRVVNALVNQNVEGYFWGPLARATLKSAWWFQKGTIVDSIMKTIRDDLTERGLMARQ